MTLNKWVKEIHENAVAHGWWDDPRSFGDIVALCHSELSEALEEFREGRNETWYECLNHEAGCLYGERCTGCGISSKDSPCHYRSKKPEGIEVELADCIIRILDYCGHAGIDIDECIAIKHEYNKTRSYKHGGKVI